MGKQKSGKQGGPKKATRPPKASFGRGPKEIVFDPEARRDYLRGFSSRKKERRAFGLAMQKVKDRKEMLEERRDRNKAKQEQLEEAERHKEAMMVELMEERKQIYSIKSGEDENSVQDENDKDENDDHNQKAEEQATIKMAYSDGVTQDHWGGHVIVTTSTHIPGDDDDKKKPPSRVGPKHDKEQEFAGNVEKFLGKLKSKMPLKKKQGALRNKGKHGAASMKGMASNAAEFKIAQKALAMSKGKDNKKRKKGRK